MRYIYVCALLLLPFAPAFAKNNIAPKKASAFHIRLHIPDVKDSMVFLAHYYGKTLYKADSVRFKNGVAEFSSNDSNFVGGSYMMILSDMRTTFEFLMSRGDDLSITAWCSKLPDGIRIPDSHENDLFTDYQARAREFGKAQQELVKRMEKATSATDTDKIRKEGKKQADDFAAYRKKVIAENPGTLAGSILKAMEKPEIPEGVHYLGDGITRDTLYTYHYYKDHYWDNFNFRDDRLIYTPLYDGMLDEYMSKLVIQSTDSVTKECEDLLKKCAGTKDVFHYTLWWLTRYVENSKIMGLSDVFVYLVENHYMKGEAFWLANDELQKYIERARKMAPNMIGNVAPELNQPDVFTGEMRSMQAIKAPYTLIVFYSPTCGHCQHELPLLDSVYEAVLKQKGVKVYMIATEGEQKVITDFLVKYKYDKKWINTWDPQLTSNRVVNYDVFSTPTMYLLDDKKIIRGKRLDHVTIPQIINMLEKREKDTALKK